MSGETKVLANFAASLSHDGIPQAVIERAKDCLVDTIGAAVFGSTLPWSKIVAGYAKANGSGGDCSVLGSDGLRVTPPMAALANGALAHAFEMDSLRQPSAGIHPGSTLGPPVLAMAESIGASGRDLITAFITGNEVMSRIGLASKHSSEKLGFHAPGLVGPIGGAVAVGRLLKFDADQIVNAMGVAGSLSSGLLEFVRSGTGGMVKRLHMGRASEGAVLAASLAKEGFTGPVTILEGEFGFLNVYCRDADSSELTRDLGTSFDTLNICLKRFSAHITAHTPIQAVLDLKAEVGFVGNDVEAMTVQGSEKMVTHHNILEPKDVMLGQYSTPYCVALAAYRDPLDPRSFSEENLNDEEIRALCRKVKVEQRNVSEGITTPWASIVKITLKDGRKLEKRADSFKGMPTDPVSRDDMQSKFMRLTSDMGDEWQRRVWDGLADLENIKNMNELQLS
jgi:2-methylcitrate dehydratase PrpD